MEIISALLSICVRWRVLSQWASYTVLLFPCCQPGGLLEQTVKLLVICDVSKLM